VCDLDTTFMDDGVLVDLVAELARETVEGRFLHGDTSTIESISIRAIWRCQQLGWQIWQCLVVVGVREKLGAVGKFVYTNKQPAVPSVSTHSSLLANLTGFKVSTCDQRI
jgi:hypothetical protein